MTDDEIISRRATVIAGKTYPDDYTVIWCGLPVGRIVKSSGVPSAKLSSRCSL